MLCIRLSEEKFITDSCHPYIEAEDYPLVVGSTFLLFDSFLGVSNFFLKKRRVVFYIVYCGLLTRSICEVYESFLMASSVTSMAQVKKKKRDRNKRKFIQINDSLLPSIQHTVNVLLQSSIEEEKS